jgi:alkaline phosphatase
MGGGQDFFEKLNTSKWKHIKTKKELARLTVNPEKPVLATFSKNHMPYSIENTNAPELIDMVKWGYNNIKRNKKGYFLMIEAGRIDHAGHENEAEKQFGEVLALDKAIEYLLRTVDLSNTLIVVTADHETGGLALSGYGSQKKVKGDHFLKSGPKWAKSKYISWATGPGADNGTGHLPSYNMKAAAHTTIDVPIYSIGKGHQKMGGFMNNNEIIHRILKLMNLKFTAKANLQNL